MVSVWPGAIAIQHQVYTPDGGTDARGNPTGALAAAVTRYVIGFYRTNTAAMTEISMDYWFRSISEMLMLTPEPTLYNKQDRVLAFDGADWLAYEVQGNPLSWAAGYPWRRYAGLLNGEVFIRRVE